MVACTVDTSCASNATALSSYFTDRTAEVESTGDDLLSASEVTGGSIVPCTASQSLSILTSRGIFRAPCPASPRSAPAAFPELG